jgi:hypothetical protein
MKKIILVFVLLLFVSFTTVRATDWENRFVGVRVNVENTNSSIMDGHIDLLVLKSDFEGEIASSINRDFKEVFSNYEDFDYLDETEWVSYCAFVEDANCFLRPEYNFFSFATSKDEYKRLDDIKFIHIASNGDTVKVSDVYNVPNPLFFQRFSNLNYYDETVNEFQSDMHVEFSNIVLFIASIMLFIAIIFAGIRTIIAYKIELESISKLKLFGYFVIIYFMIFVLSTELVFHVELIQNLIRNELASLFYYALFLLVEIAVSYFLFFRQIDKEEYIKFVKYSNGIILLIVLIIILSMSIF